MTRRGLTLILGLAALLLAAPMAQAQTAPAMPMRLVLKGYDPVAYFTDGKPTPGRPEFEIEFDRARYRFASADNMARFKADPDQFAPQFAGSCAMGLSKGMKVEADPANWLIVDGKLFVFAGKAVPDAMHTNPAEMIGKARENWKTLASAP